MRLYFLISLLIIDWIPLGSVHVLHGAGLPKREVSSQITTHKYCNYLEQNLFTDLYHSYENSMSGEGKSWSQLFRTNVPGDYHYEAKREGREQAVLFLSHLDALSFCSYQEGKQLFLSIEELVLTQIFHTDHDEEDAKPDRVRRVMKSNDGCMSTYRPSHNVSLMQDPSDFPISAVDECKISGLTIITIRRFHLDLSQKSRAIMNAMLQSCSLLPHHHSPLTSLHGHDVYKQSRLTGSLLKEAGGIDPELKSNLFLFQFTQHVAAETSKDKKMSKEIESWNDLTLITSILIASSVLFSQDHHSVHQQKYSYLKEKQACHPRQESHALDFSCLFNSPYVLDKLHYERERLTNNGLQYFSNIIKQAVTYDAYLHKLASSYGSSGCVRRNNNLIAPQETVVYMHHNITINSQHWHYKGFKMSVNSNQNSRLSQHTSNFPDDAVDRHKTSSLDPKKDSSHGTISYQYQETIAEKGANRSLDFSGYLSSDSETGKEEFSLPFMNNRKHLLGDHSPLKHQAPIHTPPTKQETQKILTQPHKSYGTFHDA